VATRHLRARDSRAEAARVKECGHQAARCERCWRERDGAGHGRGQARKARCDPCHRVQSTERRRRVESSKKARGEDRHFPQEHFRNTEGDVAGGEA